MAPAAGFSLLPGQAIENRWRLRRTAARYSAGSPRREFLQDVHEQAGRRLDPKALKQLGKGFSAGKGVDAEELKQVRA